jgi:hypothetical protein
MKHSRKPWILALGRGVLITVADTTCSFALCADEDERGVGGGGRISWLLSSG